MAANETVQFTGGATASLNGATAPKLTEWENEPDLKTLKEDLDASKPAHDSHSLNVKRWRDLTDVTGSAAIQKVKGRSSVQPKLIRRQAEWRYSALTEPFLGSEKLYDVDPATFEDTDAAKQNELVLNWQFRTKLNRVRFIDEFVRTNVDEGSAIVRVGWKRTTKKVTETVPIWEHYTIESEEDMNFLQQAVEQKMTNFRLYDETVPDEIKAAVDYFEETGQPSTAVQNGEEEVEVDKIMVNQPTLEILNPDNVYIDPSCMGDMEKALFAVVSFETSQAELLKEPDRYKNLKFVNWEGATILATPDHVTKSEQNFNFKDALRKRVVAYEYWGWYDIKGNDELVPIVATWIGDVMIRMEENPFPDKKIPLVVTNYMPKKRELMGEPDAEILEDNQKVLGALTRGMIDLMGRSANAQQGIAKGMLDVLNRRRYESGQDYEFNPNMNPLNNIIEHKYPEIPNSAMNMLTLQNQEAEALTGVKSFSGGMSGNAYGDVAAGVRGVLDAASKREMAILRRLAKGITDIGVKIIAMNQMFLSEKEVVRVTNKQFIEINREDLAGNFDLMVDISTAEVDNQKAQDLGFMLQTMGPNMDPALSQMVLSDIATLKRMPTLAEKIAQYKPQPDPLVEKLKELEVELKMKEIEKITSEIDLNRARMEKELAVADKTNLEVVETETGTKHERDMEKQRGQAQGNQSLEVTKALLKGRKPEETKPNIEAAVGWAELSRRLPSGGRPANTPQKMGPTINRRPIQQMAPGQSGNSQYFGQPAAPALTPVPV